MFNQNPAGFPVQSICCHFKFMNHFSTVCDINWLLSYQFLVCSSVFYWMLVKDNLRLWWLIKVFWLSYFSESFFFFCVVCFKVRDQEVPHIWKKWEIQLGRFKYYAYCSIAHKTILILEVRVEEMRGKNLDIPGNSVCKPFSTDTYSSLKPHRQKFFICK
jgi:hypothetical protein